MMIVLVCGAFFTIFKLGMCLNRSLKIKGYFYIYFLFYSLILINVFVFRGLLLL